MYIMNDKFKAHYVYQNVKKCCFLFQLKKPLSTVSIPSVSTMPKTGSKGEAGIALVGVHSDFPKYSDEKSVKEEKMPAR